MTLDLIRKKTFNFLWQGNTESFVFHLVKWKTLSKPMCYGGWGVKNVFYFGKALSAKSLWRGLLGQGIWKIVIMDKYLRNRSIDEWLRDDQRGSWYMPNMWNNCMSSSSILVKWIAWLPRNGRKVRIGLDPIIGMGWNFKISNSLLNEIHGKGIFYLNKIRSHE